jgi:hypothetical protein
MNCIPWAAAFTSTMQLGRLQCFVYYLYLYSKQSTEDGQAISIRPLEYQLSSPSSSVRPSFRQNRRAGTGRTGRL